MREKSESQKKAWQKMVGQGVKKAKNGKKKGGGGQKAGKQERLENIPHA